MSDEPSKSLVTLLEELGLATSGQVQSVARHVRRLAGELPPLDSVWVDALAQARLLTPYQAAEINAGRGRSLRLGPYIAEKPLGENGFAAFYRARHSESRHNVHLAIVEKLHRPAADFDQPLAQLVRASASIAHHAVCPAVAAGTTEGKVWAACEAAVGLPAAKWMVERGRFSPLAALHIARETAAAMRELERAGVWHGDLGVGSVLVSQAGNVQLVLPGLRACVRPYEGYTLADLQPEAFDTLAPERIADGAATSGSTELYAWGCVCWQLLTGRPPFAGGSSLAKLQAVHAAKLVDVRRLAPECPEILWRAIAACLAVDPTARPQSFAALCEMLGPAARSGSRDVARCLAGQTVWGGGSSRRRTPRTRSTPLATAAVVLVVAACVGSWPLWRGKVWGTGTATHADSVASVKHAAVPDRSAAIAAAEKAAGPVEAEPRRDPLVRPAGLTLPVALPQQDEDEDAARESRTHSKDRTRQTAERRRLILPSGRLLKLERLNVEPGQIVTGRDGARPRVQTPASGLVISSDDVVFENIDFIAPSTTEKSLATMVALRASTCTFVGCTFRTGASGAMSAIAIEWSDGDDGRNVTGSELRMVDCTLYRMSAGIVCQRTAGATLDLTNTLHVESGPLVRLAHCPLLRESVLLNLNRCTLRASGAAVECRYQSIPEQPGQIAINAESSVFSPREALLVFAGSGRPELIVRSIEWSGQGSLLTPGCAVAAWHRTSRSATPEALDESTVEIAGLVRSEVVFAGDASADSKASRVTDWQVPLRSDDPPGIGPSLSGRSSQPAAE